MSIFSQRYCTIPQNETSTRVCMSNTAISPLLAVATYQKVLFYDDNSEKLDFEISRGANPTYLEWHPSQPQLAIGWSHGLITLWNEETNLAKEDSNVHKAPICSIAFNPAGSRMVSCDERGLVAVWRGLSPLSTYQKEGAMTHTIFCELHLEKKEEKKEEALADSKQLVKKDSKKESKESAAKSKTSNLFFFGGKAGIVCVADDSSHCTEVCKVGGAVRSLLFYEKESSIIIITSSLLLVQFKISLNEKSVPDKKVKLSIAGDPDQLTSIWVGKSLLMTCSTENVLRAWHIDADENYLMSLASVEEQNPGVKMFSDKITCVKYDEKGRVLVAGTKNGFGIFWKNMAYGEESPSDNDQWKTLPLLQIGKDEPVLQVSVGRQSSMIAMKSGNNISIVYETQIRGKISDSIIALQTSSKCVQIYLKRQDLKDTMFLFYGDSNIRGLDCNEKALLVWNGKIIELHEIIFDMKEPATKMLKATPSPEKTVSVGMFKELVIICQEQALVSTNFQGVVKQTVTFSESEGKTIGSQLFGGFIVMWTSNNYFRVFDVSRREFKQMGITRKFEDSTGPLGDIKSCSLNCDGSKVGVIGMPKKGNIANTLMIYDLDIDSFTEHTFAKSRSPETLYWDMSDKRFFGVLTEYVKAPVDPKNSEVVIIEPYKGKELLSFFVSAEHGIKEQDSYKLEQDIEGLLGINVPTLHFILRTANNDINKSYQVLDQPMKDFAGIEKLDDYTKKAIMNFSFYLSISNMDEAYKCVKMIQNPQIWENMAQMCVKTKRLDVAETCLGNMRFARGAKLVREAATHDAIEPQLAMLAIQLGMKDEAGKLYQDCKRFDLLNKMYQASGEWDKAIQVAEKYDRIGLKTTYYKMAKQFEVARDFQRAIEFYEKSGNHRKEVPRMLMQAGQMQKLEEYIVDTKDKELYKWWGQYLESQGKAQNALEYYQEAESFSNVVRILILQNNLDRALEICEHTNDPAACYYVAKQFEIRGNISDAIQLYAKAQQVSLAIRLAIEHGMDNEIMTLSISGSQQVMLKAAAYFEQRNYNEKAVILYIKGRNFKKALDLSEKYKLYDYIKKITSEIEAEGGADIGVLTLAAKTFKDTNQQDKAVHLLIASGQIDEALELCLEGNVPISEEMIDKFLPKKENETQADQQKRQALTLRIAKKAKKQGNFQLASQLYLQLGEKLKVAKCLVKLGNTEKIITFANNARDAQIFILSAHFLQNSDWHNSPEIMKSIIQFYSKAKAFDHLSGFYDACAAVEIDEYRDYEKALAALKEAMKHAQKVVGPSRDERCAMLEKKCFLIEKFLQVRSLAGSDPGEMIRQCQQLLENPNVELAVRAGDIYAQMIEVLYDNRKLDQAFLLIQQMQKKGMIWNPYLDAEMVENIFKANGVNPNAGKQQARGPKTKGMPQDDDGELDEEIEEN